MSEEMIDVLDEYGNETGQIVSKNAIHQQGLWHQTVHVWIVNPQGELLLQRRSPKMETSPNCWDISSAGHISTGESNIDAAQREMREELKLVVMPNEFELLGTVHSESVHQHGAYINREHQDVYLVSRDIAVRDLQMQDTEVSDLRFMPWKEIQRHIEDKDPDFVMHEDEYKLLFAILQQRYP